VGELEDVGVVGDEEEDAVEEDARSCSGSVDSARRKTRPRGLHPRAQYGERRRTTARNDGEDRRRGGVLLRRNSVAENSEFSELFSVSLADVFRGEGRRNGGAAVEEEPRVCWLSLEEGRNGAGQVHVS
jgi:hypothetical protein